MPHMVSEHNRTLEEVPVEKIHLLENRILCRVLKKSNKAGRFRIAGTYEYSVKTNIGRVLKTGEGYTGNLTPGDYVYFEAWGGREFQSPTETLILLRPDNVLARIERDE